MSLGSEGKKSGPMSMSGYSMLVLSRGDPDVTNGVLIKNLQEDVQSAIIKLKALSDETTRFNIERVRRNLTDDEAEQVKSCLDELRQILPFSAPGLKQERSIIDSLSLFNMMQRKELAAIVRASAHRQAGDDSPRSNPPTPSDDARRRLSFAGGESGFSF